MFTLIGLLCALSAVAAEHLELLHSWTSLSYNIPRHYPVNETFRTDLTPITSVEVGFDRIFFAVSKVFANAPATLVYVPKNSKAINPHFEAYPNWNWHAAGAAGLLTETTCHGFISVTKLKVDRCARLWALDSGYGFSSYGNRELMCAPKLVAFNLHSNQLVRRIEISKYVLEANSNLENFVIDDTDEDGNQPEGKCDVGHIYITDSASPGVIVVNARTEKMWRHRDSAFLPHPDHTKVTVAGESLHLDVGYLGAALSSPGPGRHRDFYFSPLASKTIFSVNTAALKSYPNPIPELRELPVQKVYEKPSQSLQMCYDAIEGSLLFSPLNESSLVAYKFSNKQSRVLCHDPVALQYVTEIQSALLDNSDIYVVSTKQQKVFFDTVNPHEINQRLLRLRRYTQKEPAYVNQPESDPEDGEITYVEISEPSDENSLPLESSEPSVSWKTSSTPFDIPVSSTEHPLPLEEESSWTTGSPSYNRLDIPVTSTAHPLPLEGESSLGWKTGSPSYRRLEISTAHPLPLEGESSLSWKTGSPSYRRLEISTAHPLPLEGESSLSWKTGLPSHNRLDVPLSSTPHPLPLEGESSLSWKTGSPSYSRQGIPLSSTPRPSLYDVRAPSASWKSGPGNRVEIPASSTPSTLYHKSREPSARWKFDTQQNRVDVPLSSTPTPRSVPLESSSIGWKTVTISPTGKPQNDRKASSRW